MAKRRTRPAPLANPRSPLDAGHGQMSSIRACTCPNLSTKRCERPLSKSAAKSMISSCKGSILRSGSAVIHRLTISGLAERDEGDRRYQLAVAALRHRGPLRILLPADLAAIGAWICYISVPASDVLGRISGIHDAELGVATSPPQLCL